MQAIYFTTYIFKIQTEITSFVYAKMAALAAVPA